MSVSAVTSSSRNPHLLTDGAELVADRCRVDVERVSQLDDIIAVARGEPFGSRADRP